MLKNTQYATGGTASRYADTIDSAMRHLFSLSAGTTDEPHLSMAVWNLACLIQGENVFLFSDSGTRGEIVNCGDGEVSDRKYWRKPNDAISPEVPKRDIERLVIVTVVPNGSDEVILLSALREVTPISR
ncbi:MAG: hypothetical protein ACYC0X_00090 [Pirellulaceae bacterium]